jgi:hypothetical protein
MSESIGMDNGCKFLREARISYFIHDKHVFFSLHHKFAYLWPIYNIILRKMGHLYCKNMNFMRKCNYSITEQHEVIGNE